MPAYEVANAEHKKNFTGKQGGEFSVWALRLKDGENFVNAELVTKEGSPTPSGTINGTLEHGDYGTKLKKDKPAFNGGGPRVEDPKRSAEIRRMASQRAGIELLAVEVAAGLRFDETKASDHLLPIIQWFEDDARRAGEKA